MIEPNAEMVGERKRVNLLSTDYDHRLLKLMAAEADMDIGQALHILLELAEIRTQMEMARCLVNPDSLISSLELLVILTGLDTGLLSEDEASVCLAYGETSPSTDVAKRIGVIFRRFASEMKRRQPDFDRLCAAYREFEALSDEERQAVLAELEARRGAKEQVQKSVETPI